MLNHLFRSRRDSLLISRHSTPTRISRPFRAGRALIRFRLVSTPSHLAARSVPELIALAKAQPLPDHVRPRPSQPPRMHLGFFGTADGQDRHELRPHSYNGAAPAAIVIGRRSVSLDCSAAAGPDNPCILKELTLAPAAVSSAARWRNCPTFPRSRTLSGFRESMSITWRVGPPPPPPYTSTGCMANFKPLCAECRMSRNQLASIHYPYHHPSPASVFCSKFLSTRCPLGAASCSKSGMPRARN